MAEVTPSGYTLRAPVAGDAPAVVELINQCSIAEGGSPDFTLPSLIEDWESSRFTLATDAWVVFGPDDQLCGYEQVTLSDGAKPHQLDGYVHPAYKGQGIGTLLLRQAERRVRSAGGIASALHGTIEADNTSAQQLFLAEGYRSVRHFWRMEIELQSPAAPAWPAGIVPRAFVPGHDDRATHAAIEEAFRDHWGHAPTSFEEWSGVMLRRADFDATLWFLAFDGEQLVGAVLGFARTAEMGWVRGLAVRRPWRGRGLGLALLQQAFAAFYARGLRVAGLGVDAHSLTGATRLYQRAGMRVTERYDTMEKLLG